MLKNELNTEQGISNCYLEGTLKHSGSISGFIHVFTQLVKNSKDDVSLILKDVDQNIVRLLGELATTRIGEAGREPSSMKNLDTMNRFYWLINESQDKDPLAIEKVIAQASEHLADADFFIAEVFGILSALVELKEVCQQGAGPSENRQAAGGK